MSFLDKLNERYATKAMNGKVVSQEKIDNILEAVRLAPTSSGLQPFEVFVGWTHYSTGYGASLHQAFFQRSTVQSNITLIHTYFNQTSSNGGSWGVFYINATTIRVTKTAGTHPSNGYGYLRVTQLKP